MMRFLAVSFCFPSLFILCHRGLIFRGRPAILGVLISVVSLTPFFVCPFAMASQWRPVLKEVALSVPFTRPGFSVP